MSGRAMMITLLLLGAWAQQLAVPRNLQATINPVCTNDSSCYFGGTCSDPSSGVCVCPDGYTGNLCAIALFSACGVEGKYPVLQKESPSVQTVTCLDCDTSCFMCSGPGSNECTECNLDGSLPFLRHHTCVASCGDGYYLVDDYYCDECHINCGNCSGGAFNQCTSCRNDGRPLFAPSLGQCFATCPDGYYQDTANSQCLPCDSTCSHCTSALTTNCFGCATGRLLYSHECVAACPANTQQSGASCVTTCSSTNQFNTGSGCTTCDAACATCSGGANTDCITCASGNYLQLGSSSTCIATCPAGTYADSTNGICRSCPHNCSTCLSSGFCTACETGFFLTEGACLPSCPITFYTDSTNTSCIACDISCLSCTGSQSTQCTACISQTLIPQWPFHILFEGQCVSACPSGYGLVNGVCTNICTTGQYQFNGQCSTCPTSLQGILDSTLISAVLSGCNIDLTSTADQTAVETANTAVYDPIITSIISNDVNNVTHSENLANSAANRVLGQAGDVTSETTNIAYFKREVPSVGTTEVDADSTGLANIGARVSIQLPSEVNVSGSSRCLVVNTFRQNLYTAQPEFGANGQDDSSKFLPPAVDVRIYDSCATTGATEVSVVSLSSPIRISFKLNGVVPSESFSCFYWDIATDTWKDDGVTTEINNSGRIAYCDTTHLTSFSLRVVTSGGIAFTLAGEHLTWILPMVVGVGFLILGLLALLWDLYGRKGDSHKYPHRRFQGMVHRCRTTYRYSLLYNVPFVGIFGYFHMIVWGAFKTLWLSDLVWLMLLIEVIVFKENAGDSSDVTMVLTALACGIFLIPTSFLHWLLIRRRQVQPVAHEQASAVGLIPGGGAAVVAPQPVIEDDMFDRKIKFFDRKQNPEPDEGGVLDGEKPKRKAIIQPTPTLGDFPQDEEILSLVRMLILFLLSAVIWALGASLTIVFSRDINNRNGDHYVRFVGCFILSLVFGMLYSLAKLAIASSCAATYRPRPQSRGNRCRIGVFVDLVTLLIYDDFESFGVKKMPPPRQPSPTPIVPRSGPVAVRGALNRSASPVPGRQSPIRFRRADSSQIANKLERETIASRV